MELEENDVEDVESRSESESSGVSDVSAEDGGESPQSGQINLAYDQEEKGGGALAVAGWSFHKKANSCFPKRGSWSPKNDQLPSS